MADAPRLRVVVHDFAGHPFQVQLSRELARRGHDVLHLYCSDVTTGRGRLEVDKMDPSTFAAEGVTTGREFSRYSLLRRPWHELAYGRAAAKRIAEFAPDVVLSANTPLLSQHVVLKSAAKRDVRFVIWLQDLLSVGIAEQARKRLGFAGRVVGALFTSLERSLLQRAQSIVLITEDFRPSLADMGVPLDKTTVIENWAPMDELPQYPKDNEWARAHGLHDKFVFLYSGTLGLKHNPLLLRDLAVHFRNDPQVKMVVVSQGIGADLLRMEREQLGLLNLYIVGYQPYDVLPQVHGSADVLVVLLEDSAADFSVPSKALTYLCSSRALLAVVPRRNALARLLERSAAGLIIEPSDRDGLLQSASTLRNSCEMRQALAYGGLSHAQASFNLSALADCFAPILTT